MNSSLTKEKCFIPSFIASFSKGRGANAIFDRNASAGISGKRSPWQTGPCECLMWECCWSVVNIQQQAVKAMVELWTLLCSNKISFLLRYRIAWRMQIYRSALNQHYELYLLIKVRLRFCIMSFTRLMSVFILPALRVVMNSFLVQLCGDKWWIEWIFTQNSRKKKKWYDRPHTADILSHVC